MCVRGGDICDKSGGVASMGGDKSEGQVAFPQEGVTF